MNRIFSGITLCVLALYTSGCAVGNKHNYSDVIAQLEASNTFIIAIGTHDTRTYILNGDKSPNFVGLSRGGYGNPFNVTTLSGNSLAQEMSEAIQKSFTKKGYNAKIIHIEPHDSLDSAISKLKKNNASRLIYLKLLNWKSDTFTNTALIYDVQLMIINDKGQVIAKKFTHGRDNLGGSMMNPPSHAKKVIPIAFQQKLEELLNDPAILKALK